MILTNNSVAREDDLPLISVIIPAFNAAKYIKRAIKSVLSQSYTKWEVVVIDDGSTDRLLQVLEVFQSDERITYYHQENAGPAQARNHGLKKSQGELIAFLDADDEYPEDKLMTQWDYLSKHPTIDFVSGRIQYMGGTELEASFLFEDQDERSMKNVHLGAVLCRRTVFETVGLFDESLRQSEDVDWWMRCLEKGIQYTFLPQTFLRYYRHGSNMTLDQVENNHFFFKALHQSIGRRRATNTGKLPHLMQSSESGKFNGVPEVSILIWLTSVDLPNLSTVLNQEFSSFELILLYPEHLKLPVSEEITSYVHQSFPAEDFDAALVAGFEQAMGNYVCVFTSQAKWISKKLALQLEFLKKNTRFDSCSCLVGHGSEDQLASIHSPQDNYPRLFRRSSYTPADQFVDAFKNSDPSDNILPRVLEYHG